MQVISTPKVLAPYVFEQRKEGKTIGLVPTMGALHDGHLSLIHASLKDNDFTVCSIYVNPIQFNVAQDLINYPRNLEKDIEKLKENGCDLVFAPTDQEMYPVKPLLNMDFGALETVMEGKHRPGHFKGVSVVVSKLFNIVQPDRAYFGEKDWQQFVIISHLVQDLNFPLKIVGVPIVREDDGLAMSSRNSRLTNQQRMVANELFAALKLVEEALLKGAPISTAKSMGCAYLDRFSEIEVEYLEIVRSKDLRAPDSDDQKEPLAICIAAHLGQVRLIDNIQVFRS